MGGSVSKNEKMDSVFVDDRVKQGEKMLKSNAALRASFVKYIKDCRWTSSFADADFSKTSPLSSSTWTKFGYKAPYCSGGAKSVHKEDTLRSSGLEHSRLTAGSSKFTNCYQLLQGQEQRAVLIAVLLPMFLDSAGVGATSDNSLTEDCRNEDSVTKVFTQVRVTPAKDTKAALAQHGRIGEWLANAAVKINKSALDAYLADPSRSWIQDYQKALQRLPATVTLSKIDLTRQESKIIYTNATQDDRDSVRLVGANMHEIYSADCSPAGVLQVEDAVFGAKRYKRCAISYDSTCRLRALKPVYDTHGKHVYTLGLESSPFKDPVLTPQGPCVADEVDETVFQQVEDLLVLVPLLVRNFKC